MIILVKKKGLCIGMAGLPFQKLFHFTSFSGKTNSNGKCNYTLRTLSDGKLCRGVTWYLCPDKLSFPRSHSMKAIERVNTSFSFEKLFHILPTGLLLVQSFKTGFIAY